MDIIMAIGWTMAFGFVALYLIMVPYQKRKLREMEEEIWEIYRRYNK